jgi:ABC-type antimicrobial peptide transport system permease subunit
MGTRILRGRGLDDGDREGAPAVAVVSESMARVLWPGVDALGHCFRMRTADTPCRTVVGIAEDIVQRTLTQDQRYQYYVPIEQYGRTWGNGMLLKLRGNATSNGESVRKALQALVPGGSYLRVRSLEDIVQRERRSWHLGATMFVAFGLLALLVAAVGLYGAISYDVAQRMHEIGIRVALGARGTTVVTHVLGRSARYAVIGSVVGALIALAAGRWIQPLLFGTSVTDPRVYAGVAGLMLVVALGAGALPAAGAVRADPVKAIRSD